MPFLQDYECEERHRFEHLADSRSTIPEKLACPTCKESFNRSAKLADNLGYVDQTSWAIPVISTATAPITINRRNGDYAAREKERLTKRSKEHNRLKTSREEADANTERVVGKDTANVLFSKGLHA